MTRALSLLSIALLLSVTLTKKIKFPSNVNSNPTMPYLEQAMQTTNYLLFLFVYDKSNEKSMEVATEVIPKLAKDLEGYMLFFAFDCESEQVA